MPKNSQGRDIAEVIPDKCIGCQVCVGQCPVNAIEMKDGVARVDPKACIGCGRCFDVCPVAAVVFERVRKKKAPVAGREPLPLAEYKGVAVFIEARDGTGADVSWELVGEARKLAEKLQAQVLGFVAGTGVEVVAKDAIAYGCDVVYTMDSPILKAYLPSVYGRALTRLCDHVKPEILLLGATPLGRDLAGVVATRLETGLTADCTRLAVDPQERLLLMTRPTFGGNIMATIMCRERRPQMSTVRPRVLSMPKRDPGRHGEIRPVDFEAQEAALPRILDFVPSAVDEGGVDITRATALVVVGKGACNSRHLPMLEELARILGGTVACSRPVVEVGLLPYMRQVGQTGKTVAPRIYVGVGVSGAVQHLAGMQGSEKIIAINTDRNAPMVQIADYAILGDYVELVPGLIKGIEARLHSLQKV